MEARMNWRLDRLIVHIILGSMSTRIQRAIQTKAHHRLANNRLVEEIKGNINGGLEIVRDRKLFQEPRSDAAEAHAAKRKLTILTVRVTSKDMGSSCHPPHHNSHNEGEQENEAEEDVDVKNCTCHTVKLCMNESGQGTAFCSCHNPSACLCKHIHGACSFLTGGKKEQGGLRVFKLLKTDFRLDRNPDDFDPEIDGEFDPKFPGEMHLGTAALASAASDDDEPVGSSVTVVANPVALATILQTVEETTFAGMPLATKAELDALSEALIHSLRDRQRCFDTTIKPTQRPGRPPPKQRQSAAKRPTSGTKGTTPCSIILALRVNQPSYSVLNHSSASAYRPRRG
jgi:hypothetical protein